MRRHESALDITPCPTTALIVIFLLLGCLCLPDSTNASASPFPRTFMCEGVQTNFSNYPTSRLNEENASHKSLW